MNTKDLHPGLGSGALRERLCERITSYLTLGGLFNAELANHDAVRELLFDCRVGLSLSSPIEPPPDYPGCTVNELALELKRTVMVLCETRKHTGARPCKFCTDMHLWRLYRGINEPALRTCNCGNPAEPHLESVHVAEVRPTSQASSEIWEALEDLLINEVCSCKKYLDGKPCPRCKVAIENARELVYPTPSRQGAGGK